MQEQLFENVHVKIQKLETILLDSFQVRMDAFVMKNTQNYNLL